ncbi:protein PAT1 homolog 1 isoform X2 [Prunus yedoensis var. nudiflora]|uniref:Protein PAT1 homolog 1 isoform X2 n=1 Tax=Prunus yedoensis var. nudiflora TaxID=2094558 RepID=A0A314YKX2_PRUYE|nr:protein PAT1 homolog 1 isoform X2 [Prunus yedoensis var. nudiflora]
MHGLSDTRDHRPKHRGKQRYSQGSDTGSQKSESGWIQFRSKHMTSEEIESILKMQHAATHSNDPYIDDYYHQASLSKKSAGTRSKHPFCPSHLREFPSRGRNSSDQHTHSSVDSLGRIPLSSIRRPRPLLEVDPPSGSGDGNRPLRSLWSRNQCLLLELPLRMAFVSSLMLMILIDLYNMASPKMVGFNSGEGANLVRRVGIITSAC